MAVSSHNISRAGFAAMLLCLGLLLSACDDGGGDHVSSDCSIAGQNRFVHRRMLDRYYWYQRVADSIDYDRFASPRETLEFLRYGALDRFSYIASQSAFENLFGNGSFVGFGFGYVIETGDNARVRFVYSSSPAANAGMERGDGILEVNGQSVADIIAANDWSGAFGPARIGVPLSIRLRRKSGKVETLQMEKDRVFINTVLHDEVIDSGPNKIGYLVFNSFLGTSPAELDPVFAGFRQSGVNQLILDLRYNGGGDIGVARDLASYIRTAGNDLFLELRYNDKYQADNFRYYFKPLSNSLGLDQLTVITSAATCSASEQLISALQPYFSRVTTIGTSTCGKPVGMKPENFCDLTLVAINFAAFNAAGQGEYFSGIPADCAADDDVGQAFGDPAEPMLQAARYFIDNQACQVAPRSRGQAPDELRGLQLVVGAV